MNKRKRRPGKAAPAKAKVPTAAPVFSQAVDVAGNGRPLLVLRPEDYPDVSHLITEDGAPVDNIYVEKQYRLLTDPLEHCWDRPGGRPLVTLTNVGLFFAARNPPLVPDFLLSLDVDYVEDPLKKEGHSYFVWLFGKPPDVVGEIVSDQRGGEDTYKLQIYARQGILYYFIHDPSNLLGKGVLRVMELNRRTYRPVRDNWLSEVGLGLRLWDGIHSGVKQRWLRWRDKAGRVIPTAAERAAKEHQLAQREHRRAAQERHRAAELAEKLKRAEAAMRAAGLEPPE